MSIAILDDGQSFSATAAGFVEGVDFERKINWPFKPGDLRWTGDRFGWQRKSDPRFFACCCRCHEG